MELTPTESSHVESVGRVSPDTHPPSNDDSSSVPSNEPKFKLPSGDIVSAKKSKVDSLPEDPSKDKPSKSAIADKKSTKSDPGLGQKKDRNWKFMAVAIGVLLIATIGSLAIKLIFQSKAEVFKSPDKIPALTTAQIDEVIRSSVRLDEKVTFAYLRSKLTVSQFKSQDRQYTVFRIIAPETCGKLGCLYIIKPIEGMSIPLQLEDIGVGKEMFKSSPKFHCFTAIQRQNGEDRNFEICEQSY